MNHTVSPGASGASINFFWITGTPGGWGNDFVDTGGGSVVNGTEGSHESHGRGRWTVDDCVESGGDNCERPLSGECL
jgi:hypothetical protein